VRAKLRRFQEVAVDDLASLLDTARYGYQHGKNQAVGLTATTGAGKTIMATALIERVMFGTDDGVIAPDPRAVFLWMTDLPQLNLQTRDKMLRDSSLLGPDRLVVVENTFDAPELTPGRVYFLNTQKLGANAALGQDASARRIYPFWETVRNTIADPMRMLYLVIDEAHRGMTEGKDRKEADSIIQRFIKGTDLMPPVPIVVGISATPDRYLKVVGETGRTISQHDVPPAEVRASGLIKERVAAEVAGEKQRDSLALLSVAATAWKESTDRWAAYCAKYAEETPVIPAFIIQVKNESAGKVTQTDLASVISVITEVAGPLPDSAFAHAFGDTETVSAGSRKIRYLEPSRIADDLNARVVFFKTSLGTGWDCPRAEVMFSFRTAVDATTIAQTIGRMVRTPLARKIDEDDRLNSVDVFLPEYDRGAVEKIVTYLRDSGDRTIADSITDRSTLLALPLRSGTEAAAEALEAVPSYLVPTNRARQEVRRLIDLSRSLSRHGIADAYASEMAGLADWLLKRREALATDPHFVQAINEEGEITIDRVEWVVGEGTISTPTTLTLQASENTIASLFAGAKRALGDVAVAYVKARLEADPSLIGVARLEAFALSQQSSVMPALNAAASARIDVLFAAHGYAIEALAPSRRAIYDRIRGSAPDPSLRPTHLPLVLEFIRGTDVWSKHLYANDAGDFPLTFKSSWETDILIAELAKPEIVAWLRNMDREDWALCVPWRDKNTAHPFYPDFLFVRQDGDRLVVDVVDPHDPGKPDATGKAKGLAAYARDHGHLLGHIDLIAKLDGRYCRLHLEREAIRKQVDLLGDSPSELRSLYLRAG
jgi:type III restriction enzyme